jgi:hypothetical protein
MALWFDQADIDIWHTALIDFLWMKFLGNVGEVYKFRFFKI